VNTGHFSIRKWSRRHLATGESGFITLKAHTSQRGAWVLRHSSKARVTGCSQPGRTGISRLSESPLPSPIRRINLSDGPAPRGWRSTDSGANPTSSEFSAKKPRTSNSRSPPKALHHADNHSRVQKVVARG